MTRFTKEQALDHWRNLPSQSILAPESIPYKHRGTTYGADGIRIEGRREFIDSVLAQLKTLLEVENGSTRLSLNYQSVEPRDGRDNAFAGNFVCYIKVHERGHEAKMANAFIARARR